MLFGRIAFVGIMLAVLAGGVLQVRLMHKATLREIHLLVGQQTKLQRQIAQQDLELAQLRTPWRVADRMVSIGTETLAPSATRASTEPKKPSGMEVAGATEQPAATELVTHLNRPGGSAKSWPSHPTQSKAKKAGR